MKSKVWLKKGSARYLGGWFHPAVQGNRAVTASQNQAACGFGEILRPGPGLDPRRTGRHAGRALPAAGGNAADAASIPAWAAPAVKAALGTGLLMGDSDGRFRPDQAVTGAEAAAAVYRLQEGLNR
ncbi:S-layer homology domain-containing protein [Paenibacillus faecis]|uniref:S-layer homology domain-containing protein n=1 Tax=Paenibacillus faecis TaxID=862114 RepID=UPI001BCD157D|nr:S-layer homology domain-containing protein [Paenibacillus faecis]